MLKLTWVEMKLFLREPLAAFFTLVFPVVLLVTFGGIFGNVPALDDGGFGFVDVSVPGYIAIIIATSGLLSLGTNVAAYRDTGVLRRLRATPLRPFAILFAQALVMLAMAVVGIVALIAVGYVAYGLRCAGTVPVLAVAFAVCGAAIFAMGFMLASVAPTARSAQAIGLVVFYPMIFLSGAAIPPDLLPDRVQRAAVALPLTHAVTLLRTLWVGERLSAHLTEVAVLGAVALVASCVAIRLFRWE